MADIDLSGGSNRVSPFTPRDAPVSASTTDVSWSPSQKNKKRLLWILVFFFLLLSGGGAFWFFWSVRDGQSPIAQPQESSADASPSLESSRADQSESNDTPFVDDKWYRSENFRAMSIVIGGEAELFIPEDDPTPLEITGIRGEAFTEKNKREVRLVVTWQTNKLAQSDIEYAKGVGQTPKVVTEEDFGINHSMTIFGLDQASTYVYSIKSQDRFGNVVASDRHAVYTGAKTVSLFDLIADAIGDVFGWAVKKQ